MHDKMAKLFQSKNKEISPIEKEAKMSVIEEMKRMAEEAMGDRLKGLKKVTVASDSQEGLKAGLEKAEDVLEGSDELSEDEDMEESEELPMSEEEINQKLQELMVLKEKLASKK